MKWHIAASLLMAMLVGACGGGSGGGGEAPPPGGGGNPPPGGGNPPPGGEGDPPPGGDGSASIIFPRSGSAAVASTVIVRGTAHAPEGVAAVRVNGVPATLSQLDLASGFFAPTPMTQAGGRLSFVMSDHENEGEDEVADDVVEWTVEIELEDGDSELVVEVEDEAGGTTEDADATQILYHEVPAVFALDTDRTRVVGPSYTRTQGVYTQRLVEHNYLTREQRVHAGVTGDPVLMCLRGHANQVLRMVMVDNNVWDLQSYHLETGQAAIIATLDQDQFDPGPEFEPAAFLRRLVCSDDHDHAYLLANYTATDGIGFGSAGFARSRVFSIPLAAPGVSVLTESEIASPRWLSMDIALAADTIVSLADLNAVAPLTSVALADGQRSELTPGLNVGGTALAPVLDQDLVYVATIAGVDRVELGGSPSKTNISEVDAQDPYVFAQVRSIAYDITNDRLIVGDTDLDALIAIDATTGERSDFVSRRIGTGPPVIAPRRIAITADQTKAYLADDGGNAAERLFAVDLITGDRQQIGNIGEAANFAINGLAIDDEGGRAFVSRHSSIMEVNLETGDTRLVAAPASLMPGSLFESIATLAYDAEENRLLAGDTGINAIVAIDLNLNDAQSIFSQHGERGDGDPFATITSISLDEENRVAYVGNQLNDTILRVDLESGDREVFPTGCLIPSGDELLNQVLFDAAHDRLLIVADGLFMRDLGTGSCVQVPHSADVLSVAVTEDNRLLGTMLGSLVQIDGPSGDVVIVSR